MRRLPTALALVASLSATALAPAVAQADRRVPTERFTVYADVIDVRPVYREVRYREPRRECWTEQESYVVEEYGRGARHGHRRGTGADVLAGGVIGGVIGNQLGRGASDGARAGATIAGAIIGSAVASETSAGSARHRRHRHRPRAIVRETRPVERCRTVENTRYEERLQHYDVTYRYEGRTFTTRLPRDPGRRLELQVTVAPARR